MNSWLIPCNPKLYDVCAAFQNFAVIDWKQSMKNCGDWRYDIYICWSANFRRYYSSAGWLQLISLFATIDDSKFVISGESTNIMENI